MRITFGDLKIGDAAEKYIQRALDKDWVSEGANVKEFEQNLPINSVISMRLLPVRAQTLIFAAALHCMSLAPKEGMKL